MRKLIAPALAVSVILAGCATILHGTKEQVGISSVPSGATVTVDNKLLGATPIVANLSRKNSHIIKIAMNGFEPVEMTVTRHLSGWIAGNIIFGGLIGLAVDAITGGMYKLTPEQVAATLQKQGGSVHARKDMIYVGVVLRPDPAWQEIGTLKRASAQ
jgi:uncharacterized protein YceK